MKSILLPDARKTTRPNKLNRLPLVATGHWSIGRGFRERAYRLVGLRRTPGRRHHDLLIASLARGVPDGWGEVVTLGRTLNRRAVDVLAYFDRPGTSNGPTEAINGRLEHLRSLALGFQIGPERGPSPLHQQRGVADWPRRLGLHS